MTQSRKSWHDRLNRWQREQIDNAIDSKFGSARAIFIAYRLSRLVSLASFRKYYTRRRRDAEAGGIARRARALAGLLHGFGLSRATARRFGFGLDPLCGECNSPATYCIVLSGRQCRSFCGECFDEFARACLARRAGMRDRG